MLKITVLTLSLRCAVCFLLGLLYAASDKRAYQESVRVALLYMILINVCEFFFSMIGTYLITAFALSVVFLEGPIIYWFVRSQISENTKSISYLHFIPSMAGFIYIPFGSFDDFNNIYALLAVSRSVYVTIAAYLLIRNYAFIIHDSKLKWMMVFIAWALIVVYLKMSSGLLFFINDNSLLSDWLMVSPPSRAYLSIIYFIQPAGSLVMAVILTWWALTKPYEKVKIDKTPPSSFDRDTYSRVIALFHNKTIFQQEGLNLADTADMLAVTPRELSEAINRASGKSFPALLRQFRINAAKEMLSDKASASLTIIEIGFDAGFSNKSAFNASFKQETGLTPSEFRIKHRNSIPSA